MMHLERAGAQTVTCAAATRTAALSGGADHFAHISALQKVGLHTLQDGQRFPTTLSPAAAANGAQRTCAC